MLVIIIAALWAMYELFRKFSLVEAFPGIGKRKIGSDS
jgi:hypothetical protein